MFCPHCGKEIPDGSTFCPSCGASIAAPNTPVGVNNVPAVSPTAPTFKLKTDRSIALYILLTIVTLGIYSIVAMSSISKDINTIATRYDNKHTMHYCLIFFLIGPLTLGIGTLVWNHKLCARIAGESQRRGIPSNFGPKDFWLWNVLGSLILVGPFIYVNNLFKAMNQLCANFNVNG